MASAKENLFIWTPLNFKEGKINSQEKSTGSESTEKYDPLVFCRTCASMDPCLVPIFKEEGLEYSLNKKIEKYLPIQVSQNDDLPVHLCYHCASILIAWDSLLIGCVEAEKKLTALRDSSREKELEVEIPKDVERTKDKNDEIDKEPSLNKNNKTNEGKRDILQEKNDQTLEEIQIQPVRLMEEPDLSFSTYQHQFSTRRPFIFQMLNLRIENPFCCHSCTTISNFKLSLVKPPPKELEKDRGDFVRKSRQKKSQLFERAICENCGKTFSNKFSLKSHMKTHFNDQALTCHQCGKIFKYRYNLLRHLRVVHEGVRNHVCSHCGKRYRSRAEMKDHRNIHEAQEKIVCEECGRVFLTKSSFYPHKKTHRMKKSGKDPAAFACEECHKQFTTKKSREQHLLIHTGEKPLCCTVCGKKFRTKANYNQHAKVHSDVKPYGCEHCGKAFGRKDHLRIHVRCHTGEKPFVCDYCGRGFAQMNDMKKHWRIHQKKA